MSKFDHNHFIMLLDDDPLAKGIKRYHHLVYKLEHNDPDAPFYKRDLLRSKGKVKKTHDEIIEEIISISAELKSIINSRYGHMMNKCRWDTDVWYRQRGTTALIRINYDTDPDVLERKMRNSVP